MGGSQKADRHLNSLATFEAEYDGCAPQVAIVVIGRNEGQRLVECLLSLASHLTRTIYVDSGSEDGSTEVARRLGVHVVDLDVSRPFTAGRARSEGYRAALKRWPSLRFIQFVDGDCCLDTDWLDAAHRFVRSRDRVAIVFGRRRERRIEGSMFNALCDREWSGTPGNVLQCGGDIFARVAALRESGPYADDLIAGEEPELCIRLRQRNWLIWRIDAEMTLHDANMTNFRQWWKRNTRTGYAITEVAILYWRSPFGIWKRDVLRAIVWGGVLPLVAIVGAVFHPAALALLVFYPIQVARIARREQWSRRTSWRNGIFDVLSKFPEFSGVATYIQNALLHRKHTIIEYK